jgi:HAD superfamily hydrolase (TIGR01549 family)
MLDAVIFDVDGTLVDSVDFHAEAWQKAFAHFGREVDIRAVRSQIGKGGDQLMPVFLSEGEVKRQGKAIEAYRKTLFEREYIERVKGFPHVRSLFLRLRDDGKRLALASSAKGDELEAYKKAAGIEDFDLAETSSDDAEKSKPHPDIFQAALDRLGSPAKNCVVVGDSPYDAEAAFKAGLRTTGVLCGGFPDFDLRAAGASHIFEDPADILDHYKRWVEELG